MYFPQSIISNIATNCICFKTFCILQSVNHDLHITRYKNMYLHDILENEWFQSLSDVKKAKYFILLSRNVNYDTLKTNIEKYISGYIPIYLLLSYSVEMNKTNIAEIILNSNQWNSYRHTMINNDKHWRALLVSHILIDAVRNENYKLTELLIKKGKAYVNVHEYESIKIAFDNEYIQMYPVLLNRLFEQKNYNDIIIL